MDKFITFICYLVVLFCGLFLGSIFSSMSVEENYQTTSKKYIVEKGFGYWSPDKKLIIKNEYLDYYNVLKK